MRAAAERAKDALTEQYATSDWETAEDVIDGLDVKRLLIAALSEFEAHEWKLVPVEATTEMKAAASRISHARDGEIYCAMVAAAPRMEDIP